MWSGMASQISLMRRVGSSSCATICCQARRVRSLTLRTIATNRSCLLLKCRYRIGSVTPAASAIADVVAAPYPCRAKTLVATSMSCSRRCGAFSLGMPGEFAGTNAQMQGGPSDGPSVVTGAFTACITAGRMTAATTKTTKPRILTGDTPTGRLHLGHYVGSIENRLALQDEYDCYFLIANKHAFTTRADRPDEIRQSVIDVATDWLAVGIDPSRSTMFVQSEVPAIDELTFFFAMLIPFNRVMRNPTLAQEIKDKGLGEKYPFGFPLYAVGQCADILAFRPALVPVGEDQIPHLELTREVARKFNQVYSGVDPHTKDEDYEKRGGVFPIFQPKLGRVKRLVGTGAPSSETGQLLKMSKSLNNAIFLSDDADVVQKRIMGMYTDPKRITGKEAGETNPEKNPLWAFHEGFNTDTAWVGEHRAR